MTNPILFKCLWCHLYTRRDANFNDHNLLIVENKPETCIVIATKNTFFPDPRDHSYSEALESESLKNIGEICLAVHLNGLDNFPETMRYRRPVYKNPSKDSELYKILSRNLPCVWNRDLVTEKKLP